MTEPIRVTAVLDYFQPPELVAWRMRVGNRDANKIMKEAAKYGTRIDELIKSGADPMKKDKAEVLSCWKGYQKWREVYDPKEIVQCQRIYFKVAGIEVTGEPDVLVDAVLHDLKGTNKLRLKNWLQINIYEEGRRQNGLPPSDKLRLLRFDRMLENYEYPDPRPFDPRLVKMFEGLLMTYLFYKGEDTDDRTVDV